MSANGSVRRRSTEQWEKIIAGYPGSGITAYCQKNGISDKSFYSWRKRLAEGAGSESEQFIEVSTPAKGAGESIRIKTPGGYRLEVPAGMDSSFVRNIVAALATQ